MYRKQNLKYFVQITKLDSLFKFKLHKKQIIPTQSFKYPGKLLDEQLSHVKMKLCRGIGILSKLRY